MKRPTIDQVERTLNNKADQHEARLVAQWFGTPEGQAWLGDRMDSDFGQYQAEGEEMYADQKIASEAMFLNVMKRLRRKRIVRRVGYAAAVLLPLLLLFGLFGQIDDPIHLLVAEEYDEVYVPRGERMQIVFQDGSKMYLNANTSVRYPKRFGYYRRKVCMEGEAWFDITPNKRRPFIVELPEFSIKVLGTRFNAKAYTDEDLSVITLESGLTELNLRNGKQIRLSPGEQALYDRKSHTCRIVKQQEPQHQSDWKHGIFYFKETPLPEVLKTLERRYDVTFEVKDSTLLDYTYTLTGKESADLNTVLNELVTITPIEFHQTGNRIEVRGWKREKGGNSPGR